MTTLMAAAPDSPLLLEQTPDVHTPARARQKIAELIRSAAGLLPLDAAALLDLLENAKLVISELVTNALLYGRGPVEARAAFYSRGLLLSVTDSDPSPLSLPHNPDDETEGGRGLLITTALTTGVVIDYTTYGKKLFCLLPYPSPAADPSRCPFLAGAAQIATVLQHHTALV